MIRWTAHGPMASVLANAMRTPQLYVIPISTPYGAGEEERVPIDLSQYTTQQRDRLAAHVAQSQRWYRCDELSAAAARGELVVTLPRSCIRIDTESLGTQIHIAL